MTATYDDKVERAGADNRYARERQEKFMAGIIDDVEQASVALQLGEVHKMDTFKEVFKLSNTKPSTYWINGTTDAGDAPHGSNNNDDTNQAAKDSGLKQTTTQDWDTLYMIPDEIATLVVMPDSWMDDSDVRLDEIRKDVISSLALSVDAAIFFGRSLTSHGLPSTFGNGVVPDTISNGAFDVEGVGVDTADDYALFFRGIENRGFDAETTLVDRVEPWRLRRLRDDNNVPIYQEFGDQNKASIYGQDLTTIKNDTWRPTDITALTGEWSNLHIGVRQGVQWTMSNSAVIHDASGAVEYNAYQQDGMVLRACMRIGYLVTDPYRYRTGQREWPFQALLPANYSS